MMRPLRHIRLFATPNQEPALGTESSVGRFARIFLRPALQIQEEPEEFVRLLAVGVVALQGVPRCLVRRWPCCPCQRFSTSLKSASHSVGDSTEFPEDPFLSDVFDGRVK